MHPYLILSQAEIDEIRAKVKTHKWAQEAYQIVSANAFVWSTRTIDVPDKGGGFYHAVDPSDYHITVMHYNLANAARDLALMYRFTDQQKYLAKAREILLAYADRYLTYEIHDKEGRTGKDASAGGRATPQGINESTWVIPITWSYDLIYNELTPDERSRIETNILRPAADLLMLNNEGRHNHQTWHNSGVGVIGFALGDKQYVWYALHKDDSGFFYQMEKSVTPDGMWYEGSMHYQFYVLGALAPLAEAAYHSGIDLYQNLSYKGLFDFMVSYADETLRLPTINDGREVHLSELDRSRYYEIAYRRWRDPRYICLLQASERDSLEALLYGVDELSEPGPLDWRSLHLAGANLAVLRSGSGRDARQVVLNIMGYQGGHSHPDLLGLVLHGLGRTLAPDAGSIKYRQPAHLAWYKQSVAHNVIVVDGHSQERAPAGTLEAFAGTPHFQMARASTEDAYPGVHLVRTLMLTGDYLVDLFDASSDRRRTYDWVYHNYGRFHSEDLKTKPTTESPGSKDGYDYLTNVRTTHTEKDWEAEWSIAADQKVRLLMMEAPGTEVIVAEGLVAAPKGDETDDEKVPMVIVRRQGQYARYVAIIEPYYRSPVVSLVSTIDLASDGRVVSQEEATGLLIERGHLTDVIMFSESPGSKRYEDCVVDGRMACVSRSGSDVRWFYLGMGTAIEGEGWSVRLESLAMKPNIDELGVYVERIAPDRLYLQSTSDAVTIVVLRGMLAGELQVLKFDPEDTHTQPIRPISSEEGTIRFFMDPRAAYEIIGLEPPSKEGQR